MYKLQYIQSTSARSSVTVYLSPFLSNHKQKVLLEGEMLLEKDVLSGTRHGTVLGPVLSWYTSWPPWLCGLIKLFADDSPFFCVINSQHWHTVCLQKDFTALENLKENDRCLSICKSVLWPEYLLWRIPHSLCITKACKLQTTVST